MPHVSTCVKFHGTQTEDEEEACFGLRIESVLRCQHYCHVQHVVFLGTGSALAVHLLWKRGLKMKTGFLCEVVRLPNAATALRVALAPIHSRRVTG